MRARTIVLFVMAAFLFLGSVALRLAQDSALAQSGTPPPARYIVGKGTLSGEHYHLTSLAWQVRGTAGGGGYRLLGPAAPASSENGCCCTYLPCVLLNR